MVKKQEEMYKIVNNMSVGTLGIQTLDGKILPLRKPNAYKMVSYDDLMHIFNSTKLIQKGHAYVDSKKMRIELGLEEDDSIDVNALSKDELRIIVSESDVAELKEILDADISDGTREKIIILARDIYKEQGMDARKVKFLESETGLLISEEDGENIVVTSDLKEQKKVKSPKKTIN